MQLKRWITTIVAAPVLIAIILRGGIVFAAFIGLVATVALREYYGIVFARSSQRITAVIPLVGFVCGAALTAAVYLQSYALAGGLLVADFLIVGLAAVGRFAKAPATLDTVAKQLQGLIYIPLLLSHVILIRNGAQGALWIFFLCFCVFVGDTAAYYFGSYFGRHRLAPAVSPKKTIEGAVGGLAACLLTGVVFKLFYLTTLPWTATVVFLMVLSAAGQAGDLYESALKRAGRIKDSGGLLPGHGGLLDRIDALLFAAPVAWLFKILYGAG